MQKIITISIFLFLSLKSFGQIDYTKLRGQYSVSCGKIDSTELINNQIFLDSLSQFEIINGEDKFLYDYAWTYYRRYLLWRQEKDLEMSIKYNQKCWDQYHDIKALWNLGSNYKILGDCDRALDLTELYITELNKIDKSLIDYQQIYYRYKFCR